MLRTTRWTSEHRGMEGNEVADSYAKWAAESPFDPANREYLQKASSAHLRRRTSEVRSRPRKDKTVVPPPGRREDPLGPTQGGEGSSQQVLPTPLRTRSDRVVPSRKDKNDPVQRALVVR